MPQLAGQKRKRGQSSKHPYLSGNFAPIHKTIPLTPCMYQGQIPEELAGGEYVRNGGNPVSNEDLGRDAHWFDGDGMLSGVSFRKDEQGNIRPEFVNQYILTDLYLSTKSSPFLRSPILPSIATLVNPLSSLLTIVARIFRAIILVVISHLPGSRQAVKKISVANTAVVYHDGRALATCESGPPVRIALPGLETVGWYNGNRAEGEPVREVTAAGSKIGGDGLLAFMREWTTAHPKVDPFTKEMMLFHSCFAPPYIQYSIIPEDQEQHNATITDPDKKLPSPMSTKKLLNVPVPGVSSAKMMHDFGVSLNHTVIMDLPLSLDPLNLLKNRPVVEYDATKTSRLGVFQRHHPEQVRWFETKACCIFHTANTWDEVDSNGTTQAVNMLVCRLTSSSLVFSAGNIAAPQPTKETIRGVKKGIPFFSKYDADDAHLRTSSTQSGRSGYEYAPDLESPLLEKESILYGTQHFESPPLPNTDGSPDDWTDTEEDQCRLYHFRFQLPTSPSTEPSITHQFALSAIPFEFPSVHPALEMQSARYIYGCSTTLSSFGAALGRAVKIDALVKVDAAALIAKGGRMTREGRLESVTGCVDQRSVAQILASGDRAQEDRRQGSGQGKGEETDPISIFRMPPGWYAQEPRFVPRHNASSEDDGFLLTYAFDESQLGADGEIGDEEKARSELWVLDARDMSTVVARVRLPQRVPYGLHGVWVTESQIRGQRAVERVRRVEDVRGGSGAWVALRGLLERRLG